ncbi:MAG: hypothetical protein IT299_13040 [Dehalococcoidia bacterium]|nr:hypothetical protein [Dehalococcoidia bacterium]
MNAASQLTADTTWSNLAALGERPRMEAMAERMRRLASVEEAERVRELEAMVLAEYALPEADLHDFTRSRLRAWLELHAQDPGQSHALASAYRAVFQRVPADIALRRASVVQSVAREDLTAEELTELDELIPDVLEPVAHAKKESTPTARLLEQQPVAVALERKPRWKFW